MFFFFFYLTSPPAPPTKPPSYVHTLIVLFVRLQDLPLLTRASSYCNLKAHAAFATSDVLFECFSENETLSDWEFCMERRVRAFVMLSFARTRDRIYPLLLLLLTCAIQTRPYEPLFLASIHNLIVAFRRTRRFAVFRSPCIYFIRTPQVHGDIHALLGGAFDCSVDMQSFHEEHPEYSPGLLSFVLEYLTGKYWPGNSFSPSSNVCDTECVAGQSEPCGCTCSIDAMSISEDEVRVCAAL